MLGICIVFLLTDEWGEFLARTVVKQIARTTSGPYRIYGYGLRASEEQAQFLSSLDVSLLPLPKKSELPQHISKEHSFLLDRLVSRAFSGGCRYVATFDMDSWPITDRWNETYANMLSERTPVAAIVRTEFTDNFPFSAFSMLFDSFWREGQSSFASNESNSMSRRPSETGSGILDQLARDGSSFLRLERTNRWNPHPIMAGIYDDAFFHLGAGSRTPVFVSDEKQYSLNGSGVRRTFATALNGATRDAVLGALSVDHDLFIAELVGGRQEHFAPIETWARGISSSMELTPREFRKLL